MRFVETNCTFEHKGKTFEAGGAFLADNVGLVYVREIPLCGGKLRGLEVTDWHGNALGTASVRSTWNRYTRYGERNRWTAYRVHLHDGSIWHGRHCSDNAQALRIHRCK